MNLTPELKSKIGQMMADATDEENIGNRSDLLDRYLAEPYGDEEEGRSQFIASDVADAVEAILPDVMDVFTSSEDILEFTPVGPEDEQAAKQETQAVSHVFWQKNPGFETLYVWIKEALIQQNAYVWYGWVEKERVSIEAYEGLDYEELIDILSQFAGEEYELQEQSGFSIEEDPATGQEVIVPDGEPISIKVRCVKTEKKFEIEPFPQEDFYCTPRWTHVHLDGVPLASRRHRDQTEEDLRAMGFSEESVKRLQDSVTDEENTDARHHTRDLDESESAIKTYEVYETYARVDVNDDGVLELVRIWTTKDGTAYLEKDGNEYEEVSAVPIAALTPYIMPHRHIGRSTTEQVDDIQRVNTVLLRQLLDNTYLTNYGRPIIRGVPEAETYNDLLAPKAGSPVRAGDAEIDWHTPPSVAPAILPLLEKFDAMKEQRVGATRYNQGLDAESLNKTATGIKQIMNASQKKAKLIARTIAETGLRQLFLGIHRELRSGPVKQMVMRLRGQWVPVDPRTWKHRNDLTVNVGMGRGDRDEVRQGLFALGQVQRELMASGSRLVSEQEIFNTVSKVAETFGLHTVEPYLKNPATLGPPPPPPPPPPDPIMISAQAQAQKYAADAQRDAAKLAADEREKERKHAERMAELRIKQMAEERQQAKTASDIQTDEERLELDQNKAVMADDLERDKLDKETSPPISYEQATQD